MSATPNRLTATEFIEDLRLSLGAMAKIPWLPLLTALLAVVPALPFTLFSPYAPGTDAECLREAACRREAYDPDRALVSSALSILSIPILLFSVGWPGSERMAFLRVFRGKSLGRKEVWSVTWAFFGRFFVLGLLILAILLPVEIAIYLTTKDAPRALFLSWPFWLVLDVGLTFVTPALTYSARRARLAVGIGLRMIKETWPACAWYALVPPFAALIFIRIRPPPLAILAVSLTALAALVNLWFKGATGAFYLRRQPEVGDDGAARP